MSWERSDAAARLKAAGQLEVAAPPPLAAVREVAGRRARRSAMVMAFALALPLGAVAAGGGYALTRLENAPPLPSRGEGRGEGKERVKKEVALEKPVEPIETAPVAVVAEAPRPVVQKVVARKTSPALSPLPPALSPRGERELTPEIPAVSGSAPAPVARTSLADESRALSEALTALRVQHDAPRALALLTAYREAFPSGALRREAALATVEAHRALGHGTEALAALDELPRRVELDVLRAELNAQAGRCDVARGLLSGLQTSGALRERALFTDATCALSLGARDEAVALLEQLPDSPRARALLEKLR